MGYFSEASMKTGRNSTTEKSGMLLTLRSGPESLALTARQVPVYLMVVILHIPLPCWHGAASYQRRPSHTVNTTMIYSSWTRGACPGRSAGSDTRHSPSGLDSRTPASWPPDHHSTPSGSADGRVEMSPSDPQRSAERHSSPVRVLQASKSTE